MGRAEADTPPCAVLRTQKRPASLSFQGRRAFRVMTTMVEMGGIEPPSIAVSLRLLRAQSVKTFYSAPTFVTNT